MLVRRRRHRTSVVGTQSLRLTCTMRWMLSLSKTASILSSATFRSRRAESVAPPTDRPCALHATTRRDQRQDCRRDTAERARFILLLISSVPWPFVTKAKPRYFNLSTSSNGSPSSRTTWRCAPGMTADIALVFEAHANCCGVAVNCFKQVVHLPVAVTQKRNIVGVN